MESATTLAAFLLSEPEILAWLEVNPEHSHERALFEQTPVPPNPERGESFTSAGVTMAAWRS